MARNDMDGSDNGYIKLKGKGRLVDGIERISAEICRREGRNRR
jgi:hypothetical protein